jgi:hypothetical protein
MFTRYLKIGAFLLVCCCGSQAHSEVPNLPPQNLLEAPKADPQTAPARMNDVKNRLTDRICDVVDDVLKPYRLTDVSFRLVKWSVHVNFWFDHAGRTTNVTFDGTSTRQDLDQSLLSSMRRIDLKLEMPSWLSMPLRTLIGTSSKNPFGCGLKSLRST